MHGLAYPGRPGHTLPENALAFARGARAHWGGAPETACTETQFYARVAWQKGWRAGEQCAHAESDDIAREAAEDACTHRIQWDAGVCVGCGAVITTSEVAP